MNISWMSRRRPTRPLIRYSLWPERYKRRVTTTSPGLVASMGLSPPFLRRLPFRNSGALADVSSGCAEESCDSGVSCCDSGAGAGSSERIWTFGSSVAVNSPCGGLATSAAASICALSRTNRAASASSGSSIVMVTSAIPRGGRLVVPLKMQSAMRSARRDLWLCSPSTQEMASTTLDLPQPLGPTMQVVPEPLKVTTVRSQNDLKPTISTFRSLSKMSSFCRQSLHGFAWCEPLRVFSQWISAFQSLEGNDPACECLMNVPRDKTRVVRRHFVPRGEGLSCDKSTVLRSLRQTCG